MNTLSITDGAQAVTLWHYQNNTTTQIPQALIRRFRHRLYSQVIDSAVPVNFAHWYFADSPHPHPLPGEEGTIVPLPGDEIHESDGTVWTILEVNQSPLTGIWQAVCDTFAFAKPTEKVDHLRQGMIVAEFLPVRVGAMTTILEPEYSKRLTFYVRDPIAVERGDVFQRSDGTLWNIIRVEKPLYRARWMAIFATRDR
jgi:hypothetical protein